MILKLPLEITLNITSHLEFKDKLNLKTTCRKLNDQITKAVLFEELDLLDPKCGTKSYDERKEANDSIIQKLINDRFEGSLVKVLHIDLYRLSGPIFSQLSNLFPNVNRVIVSKEAKGEDSSGYTNLREFSDSITNPLLKWRNTIEKFVTRYDWGNIRGDLLWCRYPRLTELDLGSLQDTLNFCIGNPKVSFFTNAPLLATLTLRDVQINVKILEAIHTGFPLLKSFRLFRPRITSEKDVTLPPSIAPARAVLFLGIYDPHEFYKNGIVLEYISKKYTNLQELVFKVDPVFDYSIKTRDDLKRRVLWFREENEDEFEERVSAEIAKSESTFPIYNAVESTFFSNLPKTIKSLTLHINNIENAIAALVESDMKLTMLDLIRSYYCTKYKRIWKDRHTFAHFKKLPALKTLKIAFNVFPESLTSEIISFSITRLCIDIHEGPFYIDWVLSKFPLLEELTIDSSDNDTGHLLQFNAPERYGNNSHDSIAKKTQLKEEYPHLRILTIANLEIQTGLFDFLKILVPRLTELNLQIRRLSSVPLNAATEKIDLSHWNLNRLNLSFGKKHSSHDIHCIVTIQNVSKHVLIDSDRGAILPTACQQWNQNSYDQGQWTEMILDPIEHLKIFHYRVVKVGNNILFDI